MGRKKYGMVSIGEKMDKELSLEEPLLFLEEEREGIKKNIEDWIIRVKTKLSPEAEAMIWFSSPSAQGLAVSSFKL